VATQVRPLGRPPTGCTPAELVAQRGEVRLARYAPQRPKRHPIPVLIVPPLLVRPDILDISPNLSFVDHLTRQGLDIFLVDFGVPDRWGRGARFEDYVREVGYALHAVLEVCRARAATVLGYCLGGLFAALYAALEPERVQNLIALATPFDFSRGGPLYRWVGGLDVDSLVNGLGDIPGHWIRDQIHLFASTTMPARTVRLWFDALLHLGDREYLEKQRLVRQWLGELLPFPGEAYRQFIKDYVRANKLARGELTLGGRRVELSRIRCPVLVLAHQEDILAPPESAKALLALVASEDREFVQVSGGLLGHVDILVGKEGPRMTWPKVTSWLQARSAWGNGPHHP
jgi:polyhydroxyalkanoate synthase